MLRDLQSNSRLQGKWLGGTASLDQFLEGPAGRVWKGLVALSFVLMPVLDRGADQTTTTAPGMISIVLDNDYPPYSFGDKDGKLQGILVDQWKLWETKTGRRAELHAMDWSEALRRMRKGEFDVIDTIFETPERRKIYSFTPAYAQLDVPIFFSRQIQGITDVDSLKGFPVAVKEGDAVIDVLNQHGIDTLLTFESYDKIIQAAKERKVNVFVVDSPPAHYLLYKAGIAGDFRQSAPINHGEFHRAVRRGDEATLQLVEQGFAAMTPDELAGIDRKWLGREIGGGDYLALAGYTAAGAVVLLVGLAFWNFLLKRQVARSTAELRRRSALFEAQMESSPDGILVVDQTGKKIVQNQRMASDLWKIPPEILDDSDHARQVRYIASRVKNPRQFAEKVHYLYSHPNEISRDEIELNDGRVVDRYSAPVLDKAGNHYGRIWTFRDITERKRAEETLAAERTLLRTLFDVLPDYIYVKDTQSRFITCNNRTARMLRASSVDEVVGKTDGDFYPAELAEVFRADEQAVFQGKALIDKEESSVHPDGITRFALTSKLPLRDNQGRIVGLVGCGRDITDRKKLEEQLRQAQKMEAVGQLSGGVAHDFNNLLTVIMGNLGLIRATGRTTPELDEPLLAISRAADRAANLTRQLLAFSRQQVMQTEDLDLNEVVANIAAMMRRLLGEPIEIQLGYAPQALMVNADPSMLEQVILNLCLNARDAMPHGGRLSLNTEVIEVDEASARKNVDARSGTFARLAVTDTGTGILPENLSRIFEPFFTTKEVGKGTGLGLASVYGIVQQHRGWVEVQSEPGHGATFQVFLPLLPTPQELPSEPVKAAGIPGGTETILLVEDDTAVKMVAQITLTRLGYLVLSASTGNEALQIWQTHKSEIRLVLTDMVMPEGLSGRDIAERFKQDNPGIRIIFMSGYNANIAGTRFPQSGGDTFLGKPFEIEVLANTVRRCLDRPHPG